MFLAVHVHAFLLDIYLPVKMLLYFMQIFNFSRYCQTVFHSSYTSYTPVSSIWEFITVSSLPILDLISPFNFSHSDESIVYISLLNKAVMLCGFIAVCLLLLINCSGAFAYFSIVVIFKIVNMQKLVIFGLRTPYKLNVANTFSLSVTCFFNFLMEFLMRKSF